MGSHRRDPHPHPGAGTRGFLPPVIYGQRVPAVAAAQAQPPPRVSGPHTGPPPPEHSTHIPPPPPPRCPRGLDEDQPLGGTWARGHGDVPPTRSHEPAGAMLTGMGTRYPPSPGNRGTLGAAQPVAPTEPPRSPGLSPPHPGRHREQPQPEPGGAEPRHRGSRLPPAPRPRPQPLTGTRSSRCAAVLAARHGLGRVQRSIRKATCVPGCALPPIPPRPGNGGGLRSPHHPAQPPHRTLHPPCLGAPQGFQPRCGGPQKQSGPPPGPGVFPGQGAERTADGKPEAKQQLLYSAAWAARGGRGRGVTWVRGG